MVHGGKGEEYGYPTGAVSGAPDVDGNGVVCERAVSNTSDRAVPPSSELTGTGDSLVTCEFTAGEKILDLTHTGESVFIVVIQDKAEKLDQVVTHVGPYQQQQLVIFGDGIPGPVPGPCSFMVIADGDWTIVVYEIP